MKTTKLFIMRCLACICMVVYSVANAEGNDRSIFLEGRIANNDNISNCSGSCSADPGGALGIGFTRKDYEPEAGFTLSTYLSVDYSSKRFVINGNVFDVTEKGIHIHLDTALQSHPDYVFSLRGGLGWATSSAMNLPDRTVFSGETSIDLI